MIEGTRLMVARSVKFYRGHNGRSHIKDWKMRWQPKAILYKIMCTNYALETDISGLELQSIII